MNMKFFLKKFASEYLRRTLTYLKECLHNIFHFPWNVQLKDILHRALKKRKMSWIRGEQAHQDLSF